MTTTQKQTLLKSTLSAKSTLNWWATKENKYPPRPQVNIEPLINGEAAFGRVAELIEKATKSIDIISWGFDPSLELVRPNGKPIGDLLAEKGRQGVEVRILIWKNAVANFAENTLIGDGLLGSGGATPIGSGIGKTTSRPYSEKARLERQQTQLELQINGIKRNFDTTTDPKAAKRLETLNQRLKQLKQEMAQKGDYGGKIRGSGGTYQDPDAEKYTRKWFARVHGTIDNMPNVELRTRDFNDPIGKLFVLPGVDYFMPRVQFLVNLFLDKDPELTLPMMMILGLFPSHHQKMILTDYELPQRARAMVMGHNLHRNYWDTDAHEFDDIKGKRDPGFGPWQDISTEVSGPVLFDLNENFCKAWDKESNILKYWFGDGLTEQRSHIVPVQFYDEKTRGMAQIVRTHPRDGGLIFSRDHSIKEAYVNAIKNSFDFLYMENQYFRYAFIAREVKKTAQKFEQANLDKSLHWFVVTNNPAKKDFSSTTYAMMKEVGQEQLMPQAHRDRVFEHNELLEQKLEYEEALAETSGFNGVKKLYLNNRIESINQKMDALAEAAKTDPQEYEKIVTSRQEIERMVELEKQQDEGEITPQGEQELSQLQQKHGYDKIEPELFDLPNLKTVICTLTSHAKIDGKVEYKDIYVHSKLLVVDDVFCLLSSANINHRSMEKDTELGICGPRPKVAKAFTDKLWPMHAGKKMDITEKNFSHWQTIATKNWKNRQQGKPLLCTLTRFWDTKTPYASAVD